MSTTNSLALLTDLYQLTMAYGYWKLGRSEQRSVFHLFFRKPPFGGGYAVAAGLGQVLEFLAEFSFDDEDIEYLATLEGNDGEPLFDSGFLEYLGQLRLTCDVDAIPEGTVVFAHEPLLRVTGPIIQCQILETALLNIINFQTLIATKAARICGAAGGDSVLEFGLRRAQGIDGALSASRAAFIGGCAATSNVLAGKRYGIPVKGTHAHSWVMSFENETEAFEGYADAMPNNCVFLVDTYDTLEGVRKAIEVGKRLRQRGHEMVGIRLDSGDLCRLSIDARKLLDEAGFPDSAIVASNDLDESIISRLKKNGARIAVWGVGTKLSTAYDQPALGGVYKLGAIINEEGEWIPKVKLSEQAIKTSIPGVLQVRRFEDGNTALMDVIYDEVSGMDSSHTYVDLVEAVRREQFPANATGKDLLVAALRSGGVVLEGESIEVCRMRAQAELEGLRRGVKRIENADRYPVGLEVSLHEKRQQIIRDSRPAL
ncbi:MAG: nicotinate phosphoribosyltransferase [Planctomycetota bacterium]